MGIPLTNISVTQNFTVRSSSTLYEVDIDV